jgi:hypothetical protein
MRLRKILMVASVTFACVAQAQDLTIMLIRKVKSGSLIKMEPK